MLLENVLDTLQAWPGEAHTALLFLLCMGSIFIFWVAFGLGGLVVYTCIASIVCNLQVLKVGCFYWISHPMALGTVLFTSIYFASDLITEFYGPQAARHAVLLNLASGVLVTVWLICTVAHPPDQSTQAVHHAMCILFLPAPALTIAGLLAYGISMYTDIWIFNGLKKIFSGHRLGLRTSVSNFIAGLVDTIIFNVLAWVIFAPQPVTMHTLCVTYIGGTMCLRLILSWPTALFMYKARLLYSYITKNPSTQKHA